MTDDLISRKAAIAAIMKEAKSAPLQISGQSFPTLTLQDGVDALNALPAPNTGDTLREAARVLLDMLSTPFTDCSTDLTRDQVETIWTETRKHSGFGAVNAFLRVIAGA